MPESAQVIDLSEVRRQRAERATRSPVPSAGTAPTLMPPMAWMPMWFFMPVWIGPAPLPASLRV
jgi:hypothetical protein